MHFAVYLPLITILFSAVPASAELYKWVDGEGNVHFSDSKPEGDVSGKVKGLAIATVPGNARDAYGTPYARLEKPIQNLNQLSKTIDISMVKFDHSNINGAIGQVYSGKLCKNIVDNFIMSPEQISQAEKSIRVYFSHTARRLGYKLAEKKTWTSMLDKHNNADLSLVAHVNNIKMNSCIRKYIAVRKHNLSSYYKVTWTLYDNKSGMIVYEGVTKGYDSGSYYASEVYSKGIEDSGGKSIRNMVANLFAQQMFVSKLSL